MYKEKFKDCNGEGSTPKRKASEEGSEEIEIVPKVTKRQEDKVVSHEEPPNL